MKLVLGIMVVIALVACTDEGDFGGYCSKEVACRPPFVCVRGPTTYQGYTCALPLEVEP